jgi:hypothetical protein
MGQRKVRRGQKNPPGVLTIMNPTVLPFMRGEGQGAGGVDYVCAGCGAVLLENVFATTFGAAGVTCPICKTLTYFD